MPFLSTFLILPLEMYTADGGRKRNFAIPCVLFEAQKWLFLTVLVLGSYCNGITCSLKGYQFSINPLQSSPTPPLPQEYSACLCARFTLDSNATVPSMQSALCCVRACEQYKKYAPLSLRSVQCHSVHTV